MAVTATPQTTARVAEIAPARPSRSLMGDAWRRLLRNKAAVAGMLVIAFFALHDLVQDPAIELAFAPTSRMGERRGMLAVSVVKPFLVAWPVACVCALVYGRRAAWVGALVALPTAGRWAWLYLASAHLPWVKAAYSVELLGLVLFLPLIAARMQRRLGDGKLLLAPTTTPPPA